VEGVESEEEVEGSDSSAPRQPSPVLIPNTFPTDYGNNDRTDGGQRLTASKLSTPRTEGNQGSSGPSPNLAAPSQRITRAQLRQAAEALKGKGKMQTPRRLQISSSEDSEDGLT
jgi:hypothetical protein